MLRVGMLSGGMDGVMLRGVMPCDAMLLLVVRGVVQLLVPWQHGLGKEQTISA